MPYTFRGTSYEPIKTKYQVQSAPGNAMFDISVGDSNLLSGYRETSKDEALSLLEQHRKQIDSNNAAIARGEGRYVSGGATGDAQTAYDKYFKLLNSAPEDRFAEYTAPWGEKLTNVNLSTIQNIEDQYAQEQAGTLKNIGTPDKPAYVPTSPAPAVQTASAAQADYAKKSVMLDNALQFYQQQDASGKNLPAIYKDPQMKPGTEFKTEQEAIDAGVTPYWKPGFTGQSNVQIKPMGNPVTDQRITEIKNTASQFPDMFSSTPRDNFENGIYQPTLIEIASARPDVLAVAKAQGGDPFTVGTLANTWLNNWYNSTGKAEGADMVRQGILKPHTTNQSPTDTIKKVDTSKVTANQDAYDNAVKTALTAKDNGDLLGFKQSMDDLKVSREKLQASIDELYTEQKKWRQSYMDSLKPSVAETDLNKQLTDLRAGIDQTTLNAQAGINKISASPSAQGLKLGAQSQLAKQANLTLQTQAAQEKNLVARLGIETGNRQATTQALQAGLSFLGEDIQTQMAVQTRLDSQEQQVLDRFDNYTAQQKKDAADILTSLAGVDPSTLSGETMTKLAQISAQRGVSLQDILSGLQLQHDQLTLANAKEQATLNKTNADIANQAAQTKLDQQKAIQDQANADRTYNETVRKNKADEAISWTNANTAKEKAKTIDNAGNPVISPYQEERITRNINSIKEIRNKVSNWTVGWGSLLSGVPTTESRAFKADVDTLKANITFGELTAMREASKTGGALGQVSDKENQLLGQALGSLDTGLSKEQFLANLDQIEGSINRWQKAVSGQSGQQTTVEYPKGSGIYFSVDANGDMTQIVNDSFVK